MPQESKRSDVAEELRLTLDAAHDTALRAVHEADARAARANRSAHAQRVRAVAAIEVAAEELATLAAALRDAGEPEEPIADLAPLDGLSAEIETVHPEPAPEPSPRSRPAASRRASLHDSPIASMFQASCAPSPELKPEASPEPGREARARSEPIRPPEPPDAAVVRARPGLVETWRRRVAAR